MAKPLRIISKLESKGLNLIKGISFDGHRVLGQTHLFAKKYFKKNIDEIIYLDTVASLYSRPLLNHRSQPYSARGNCGSATVCDSIIDVS